MRTTTEVGEVTLCIGRDGAVLQVLFNVFTFVSLTVSSKLLQGIGLRDLMANHGLLLTSQFLHLGLNRSEVAFLDHLAFRQQHVVEETVLNGRAETKLYARIELLQGLGQQVGRGMPEGMLSFVVVKLVKRDFSIFHDGAVQFDGFSVNTTADDAACKSRRNALSNL